MGQRKVKLMSIIVTILVLTCGTEVSAQANRQAKPAAQPEDPVAQKRKKLENDYVEVNKKIAANCVALKETIITANAISSELAYDDNQVDPNFETDCQFNGELKWTATRVFSPSDLKQTPYTLTVKAMAAKLRSSVSSSNGSVQLISETATIEVTDGPATRLQVKWSIDLREEEYAERFVSVLKDLATNLKTRKDVVEEYRALPPPPQPPQRQKPKRRG